MLCYTECALTHLYPGAPSESPTAKPPADLQAPPPSSLPSPPTPAAPRLRDAEGGTEVEGRGLALRVRPAPAGKLRERDLSIEAMAEVVLPSFSMVSTWAGLGDGDGTGMDRDVTAERIVVSLVDFGFYSECFCAALCRPRGVHVCFRMHAFFA